MRKDIFEAIIMEEKRNCKINYSKIAKKYNCDYRTVQRYFERRDQNPIVRKKRTIVKVTDGFEDLINEKFIDHNAPAIAIYNLLKEKYNYKGSYTSIKSFTHNLKLKKIKDVTIRFETNPGLQAQVDWKESLKIYNKEGQYFIINLFLIILGYSRKKYIELTLDRSQPTMLRALSNSFYYFGGVPKEILFDNMKTVVDRPRTQFDKPVYNQTFYSYSKDAGFVPLSCVSWRPETKGKVETVAKITNRLKAYNNEFETIDELIEIVKTINRCCNNEIQATTKEIPNIRFEKEKHCLNPLPRKEILEAYFSSKPITRKVPKDSLVYFQGNRYSVSPKYIGKSIEITRKGSEIIMTHNGLYICTHSISAKAFNYIPSHYQEIATNVFKDENLIEKMCKDNLKLLDKIGGK